MSFDKSLSFAHWKSQASITYSSTGVSTGSGSTAAAGAHTGPGTPGRRPATSTTTGSATEASVPRSASGLDSVEAVLDESTDAALSKSAANTVATAAAGGRTASTPTTSRTLPSSRSRGSPRPFAASIAISPTSNSHSQSQRLESASPTSSSQGVSSPTASSFEKISVAQLSILLDTNSDKDGPKRWDQTKSQRAQRLLESGGSEVFAVFVKKAILFSFSHIFLDSTRPPHGTHKLLEENIDSVRRDPHKAFLIVDTIDAAKEEQLQNLDVAAFVAHFIKDLPTQIILTVAFAASNRESSRTSARSTLTSLVESLVTTLDTHLQSLQSLSATAAAFFITCLSFDPQLHQDAKSAIYKYIQELYLDAAPASTLHVEMASQSWKLPDRDRHIIDALKKAGPRSAASKSSIEDIVSSLPQTALTAAEVSNALLFMLFAQPAQHYNINEFITVLKSNAKSKQLDWNAVVRGFDLPELRISTDLFARLLKALVQIASDSDDFEIESLWAGEWTNPATQTNFLRAFFEMPTMSPAQIPGFTPVVQSSTFANAPAEVVRKVEADADIHQANLPAMKAVFDVILGSDTLHEQEDGSSVLHAVVRKHLALFMLSLVHVASLRGDWSLTQEKFLDSCFAVYLNDQQADADLILRALFHQDQRMVECLCRIAFHGDPRQTLLIAQKAQQLGWTEYLLQSYSTPLALDIACLLQKQSDFDLDQWISQATQGLSQTDRMLVGTTLWKFLRIKADDEYRHQKDDTEYQSISLSLPAVFVLLWKVRDMIEDPEQIKNAQCTCLTTYPRLMNFGTDFDEVLEQTSQVHGHRLAPETDLRMSELFGRMYRSELSIRDMINEMRSYKQSQNPQLQDLFCCIVHGLFDEYGCYGEYPEEALEKTALLFGSIVKFRLLPLLPQEYGLTLIVDAVRDQAPDTPMHRFGIEALLQVGDQLVEWPRICEMLLQIPTLQHPEILQRAREGLNNAQPRNNLSQQDEKALSMTNGADGLIDGASRFRSLHAEPPPSNVRFQDPDQRAQEKILFVVNNLSQDNMDAKISDLREVLEPEHYQWFAAYLVEQRARLELNNQTLYKAFLLKLNEHALIEEVVRETYVAILKSMSAKATMDSATEKGHLKSLGAWLGSLTIARDRPIKHDNIYFLDLLLEAFETQRLVIVIPFTCKVLVQGKESIVFQPPNPWLMEILGVLIELYNHADLKLNLKFEIEVLCKDLALDHKQVAEADFIREYQRQQRDIEELENTSAIDNIEEYDLTLRNGRLRETFSVAEIMSSLPNLESVLRWPPPSGTQQEQQHARTIIAKAVHRAIEEIIAPVVERSITIASLSTNQLVSKDYATEPNADRLRDAAHEMVKSLAGSLALVTCKEPLRMSIQNYIRQYVDETGGAFMPEGTILMTVNDNLDIAAQLVKEAAESRALPEMDSIIEQELAERRRHAAEHSNGDFYNQNLNRWSTWIPEPYKMAAGNLNEAQRAVYEDFARRVGSVNVGHVQNASTDSTGRQLPDVLNESLAMPNLSTPAGQPALPHGSPLDHDARGDSVLPQQRVNGIPDTVPPAERILLLLDEVAKSARAASPSARLSHLTPESPITLDIQHILRLIVGMAPPAMEAHARHGAEKITGLLVQKPPTTMLEAQALTALLQKLSSVSESIVREVIRWTTSNEESLLNNSYVVAAFLTHGFMEFSRVDSVIAGALREHSEIGLRLLHDLMDQTMFNDEPIALRADLVNSIVALYAWLAEDPENTLAMDISNKLKSRGIPEIVASVLSDEQRAKQDQMGYIFREWVALFENSPFKEAVCAKFMRDLHNDQIINSTEDLVTFLRLSIEASIETFESELRSFMGTFTGAHTKIDALALLVVLLVKFQGSDDGAVKLSKVSYMDTILSLIVLIVHHHSENDGLRFNGRVFTRLFASILYFYADHLCQSPEHVQLMQTFAKALQSMQPSIIPGFAFGWTSLLSHRVFMLGMLQTEDAMCMAQYKELTAASLAYPSFLAEHPQLRNTAGFLLRGVYRNLFVLQNDFPDFVCQHHAYLCARAPLSDPALRNLLISAPPYGVVEPNPLATGLRVDRIDDMKKQPFAEADITHILEKEAVLQPLNEALRQNGDIEQAIKRLIELLSKDSATQPDTCTPALDCELLESLVVHIGQEAVVPGDKFDSSQNHVQIITRLLDEVQPRQQLLLIMSIFDQIRYPNAHTDHFCKLILHIWGTSSSTTPEQTYIRELITRVLRERVDVLRPNPWGAVVVFKELTENANYGFWDQQPFVNEPELRQRLVMAARGH